MRLLLCFFVPFSGWLLENVMFIFRVRYYIRKKDLSFGRSDLAVLGIVMCFLGIIFMRSCSFGDKTDERVSGALFYEAMFLLMTLVGWIDQKKKVIPNGLNLCFLLLGIWGWALGQPEQLALWERFAGAGCISIPVILINRIYPGAFGNGDVKFLASLGFAIGWELLIRGVLTGSFLAAIGATVLLMTRRIGRKDTIAFGPYLCGGIAIHLFLNLSIFMKMP